MFTQLIFLQVSRNDCYKISVHSLSRATNYSFWWSCVDFRREREISLGILLIILDFIILSPTSKLPCRTAKIYLTAYWVPSIMKYPYHDRNDHLAT